MATTFAQVTPSNNTISLPEGFTNHDDPNLLCMPPSWTDLAIFFLGNYVAHAATVVSRPGESPVDRIVSHHLRPHLSHVGRDPGPSGDRKSRDICNE
jgi:hypothetical protein